MKDTLSEVVADHVVFDLVGQLEGMGMRRHSIIAGMELAIDRLKADNGAMSPSTGDREGGSRDNERS